jgi:uncharacterized protein YndB with AHSA1/START domain
MTFDEKPHLIAVRRQVTTTTRDGATLRSASLTRVYATTQADLWNALTQANRLPRWFAKVTGDLRLGGRFQIEGNASGQILTCQPSDHLGLTWEYGNDVSWVEVHLSPTADGQARLTLTHSAPESDHWAQFGPGAAGVGWEWSFMELARQITTPGTPKFEEEAFAATPHGKAFVMGSSHLWGQATIAAGADMAEATAAARRTAAFFLGLPEDAL